MRLISAIFLLLLALTGTGIHAEERDPYIELFSLKKDDALKKGQQDAAQDAKLQIYKLLTYGLPGGPTEKDKMLEKLGIKRVAIAGCIVSEGIRGYAEGYNLTMKPILEQKFGPQIFETP